MSCITSIPVVDFSAYSLDKNEPDVQSFQTLTNEVHEAFSKIGFVYLKNYGIPQEKIHRAFDVSLQFFQFDIDVKQKYIKPEASFYGYVQPEREGLNPDRPHKDLKESFDLNPAVDALYPDMELPAFREAMHDLHYMCILLHQRILEVMGRGLKLEDPLLFLKAHKKIGTNGNNSTLRTLHYPPTTDSPLKLGQVRCGEHSDYGGITLLFQDKQGGLEVRNIHGDYIKATPIEDTVLINIWDLMQRWTSDTLISTKHRVMMPQTDEAKTGTRQSIAFFGNPDNGEVITCVDGSNKYPPVESLEYLNMRYSATY